MMKTIKVMMLLHFVKSSYWAIEGVASLEGTPAGEKSELAQADTARAVPQTFSKNRRYRP